MKKRIEEKNGHRAIANVKGNKNWREQKGMGEKEDEKRIKMC